MITAFPFYREGIKRIEPKKTEEGVPHSGTPWLFIYSESFVTRFAAAISATSMNFMVYGSKDSNV